MRKTVIMTQKIEGLPTCGWQKQNVKIYLQLAMCDVDLLIHMLWHHMSCLQDNSATNSQMNGMRKTVLSAVAGKNDKLPTCSWPC